MIRFSESIIFASLILRQVESVLPRREVSTLLIIIIFLCLFFFVPRARHSHNVAVDESTLSWLFFRPQKWELIVYLMHRSTEEIWNTFSGTLFHIFSLHWSIRQRASYEWLIQFLYKRLERSIYVIKSVFGVLMARFFFFKS